MDGMIVKSLTIDIETIKQDALKNTKKIKGLKRTTFFLGLVAIIGGVELYLQNQKLKELEDDICELQMRSTNEPDDDLYSSDVK